MAQAPTLQKISKQSSFGSRVTCVILMTQIPWTLQLAVIWNWLKTHTCVIITIQHTELPRAVSLGQMRYFHAEYTLFSAITWKLTMNSTNTLPHACRQHCLLQSDNLPAAIWIARWELLHYLLMPDTISVNLSLWFFVQERCLELFTINEYIGNLKSAPTD